MNKYKKDYLALQNLWNVCALRYLSASSREDRYHIVDDFRDTLIDIRTDDEDLAIRNSYEKWEREEWLPFCEKKLVEWSHFNSFESNVEDKKVQEFENIKLDYNYMRYRKIMQLIQDSGIGLGQGSGGEGHYVGPSDIGRFTR